MNSLKRKKNKKKDHLRLSTRHLENRSKKNLKAYQNP